MRAVLQRVTQATVRISDRSGQPAHTSRSIGHGMVVLLGVAHGDSEAETATLAAKIRSLRIFADPSGRMNLDIGEVGGAVLLISQFTLLADTRRGRRPGFAYAADPSLAQSLYRSMAERLRALDVPVETGEFGAHMVVELANDGPVTILLDTAE